MKIGLNTDAPKNYIGGHLIFDNFKTCNFGDKKYGSLFFGNSGIQNVIPYLLEVDLIGNWIPQFRYVK